MNSTMSVVGALAAALALVACLDTELPGRGPGSKPVVRPNGTKPLRPYYSVRPDFRRCVSPLCGGYWVSSLNEAATRCADGSSAAECYVAELVLPPDVTIRDGDIVHGELGLKEYPERRLRLGVLKADAVLSPVLEASGTEGGTYGLVFDTGIRCITTPCPSLALAVLNQGTSLAELELSLEGSPEDQAALDRALSAELAGTRPLGAGAVALGKLDQNRRRGRADFAIENVFVAKLPEPEGPECVVLTESSGVTAWNFRTAREAREFASNLGGEVELLRGSCGDALVACTREYAPVHGVIDAVDVECVEASNACGFRAEVIRAAGATSKASGRFQQGPCPGDDECATNEECKDGFCGWNADGARVCRPWAQLGERCEGFVLPEARRFCAPELTCHFLESTGDAGGVCLLPGSVFPCGDAGLNCDFETEYCQITVGGVPLPDGGPSITAACVDAGECRGFDSTCECLEADDAVLGSECDDSGGFLPVVTFYAP